MQKVAIILRKLTTKFLKVSKSFECKVCAYKQNVRYKSTLSAPLKEIKSKRNFRFHKVLAQPVKVRE